MAMSRYTNTSRNLAQSSSDKTVQDLSLGLFRSDYMVHQDVDDTTARPTIKQVEFNTMASSFGGLSTKVSELHSYAHKPVCFAAVSF